MSYFKLRFALFCAVLITFAHVVRPAAGQERSGHVLSRIDQLNDYFSDRADHWKEMLSRAGRPSGGLLIVARPVRDTFDVDMPVELLISTQNVTERRIAYSAIRGDVPLALIRDENGKPVPRTNEGNRRYGPSWWLAYAAPTQVIRELAPNAVDDRVLSLTRFYDLRSPGAYTVLIADSGSAGRVAKPVTIRVVKEERARSK